MPETRNNGEKYLTYKQFTGWAASLCVAAIAGAWIVMQAHASEPHKTAAPLEIATGIQQDLSKILAAMAAEKIARKTALELKRARTGLSPEEEVELNGLKEILKALGG